MKICGVILAIICIYVGSLMLGQAIPKELVFKNVVESYEELDKMGLYYDIVEGAQWDNWTDTYFLNAAITQYDGNILKKALANSYTTSKNSEKLVLDSLSAAIHEDEKDGIASYSRYWAGNLTLYKILLIFVPISGIRNILLSVSILLFVFASINMYKILGYKGVIPFLLCVLACKYIPLSMCLTFASDIIIMLGIINFLAVRVQKGDINWKRYYSFFALIGSVCIYLGYWAFPLITLGIPLVFITILRMHNRNDEKDILCDNVCMSIFWGMGLCGTVLIKQVLCYLILGSQSGTSALNQRLGAGYSIWDRVLSVRNVILRALSDNTVMIVLLASLLIVTYFIGVKDKYSRYGICPLLCIAVYPIMWCLILAQHNMHGFVVYMYGVTYYALFSLIFWQYEKVKFHTILSKKNIIVFCAWILVSCFIGFMPIYYDNQKQEPWSTDEAITVDLADADFVQQHIAFETEQKPIHLKKIKVIIDNTSDDSEGVLHVSVKNGEKQICKEDIQLSKINSENIWEKFSGDSIFGRIARRLANNSKWEKIKLNCTLYSDQDYVITYSVDNVQSGSVNLYAQDESQGAPANADLYIDNEKSDVTIMNVFYYNRVVSIQAKLYFIVVALSIIQVLASCISKRIQK